MALNRASLIKDDQSEFVEIYVPVNKDVMNQAAEVHFDWQLDVQKLKYNVTRRWYGNEDSLQEKQQRIVSFIFDLGTEYINQSKKHEPPQSQSKPSNSILKPKLDKVIGLHAYLSLTDDLLDKYIFAKIKVLRHSARISGNDVMLGAEYLDDVNPVEIAEPVEIAKPSQFVKPDDASQYVREADKKARKLIRKMEEKKPRMDLHYQDQLLPLFYPILSLHDKQGNVREPKHSLALKAFYENKKASINQVSKYIEVLKKECHSVLRANVARKVIKLLLWEEILSSLFDKYTATLNLSGVVKISVNLKSLIRDVVNNYKVSKEILADMNIDEQLADEIIKKTELKQADRKQEFYSSSIFRDRTLTTNIALIDAEEALVKKYSYEFERSTELKPPTPQG